jgi:hypothetical protein
MPLALDPVGKPGCLSGIGGLLSQEWIWHAERDKIMRIFKDFINLKIL